MLKLCRIAAYAVMAVGCAAARESVCLRSGFCLDAESHSVSNSMLILQRGSGTLQFPIAEIDQIVSLQPAAIVAPVPIGGPTVTQSSEEALIRAALGEGLKPDFVRSVAKVESGLNQNVRSPRGAIGLMQLMPNTAGQLGVDASLADQNAQGGAAYLRQLLLKYKGDLVIALAAYNAGPGAVAKYRGVPPYPETRRYIVRVLAEYNRLQRPVTMKIAAVR